VLPSRTSYRVGPKGYVHGWIHVGGYGDHPTAHLVSHSGVTPEEAAAVKEHAASSYGLNGALRHGLSTDSQRERVRLIDSAIGKSATTRDLTVHRGLSAGHAASLKPGAVVSDKAFGSVTTDPRVADMYGDKVMQIHLPAGTNAVPGGRREQELILPRGTAVRVDRVEGDTVHAHIEPQGTPGRRARSRFAPEYRTAETPIASTVHEPFGSPSGPGLFHHKGLQLPAYIQHVAHRLVAQGHPRGKAIGMAVGIIRNWAEGHDGHGNHVHPDVQAAAAKALAEWEADKAIGGKKRSSAGMSESRFNPNHAPAGVGGGQFTSSGGAGKGGAKSKPAAKAAHRPAPHHGLSAAEKQHLLDRSDAIRKRIHGLRQELETLEKQQHAEAKAAKAAKAAAAKAGHKHVTPGKAHKNPAHTGASHKTTTHKAKSLADRISGLHAQIKKLRQQADELEAQAGGRGRGFAYDPARPPEHRYYDGSWG
jgi:hypothetical protein